MKSRDNARSRPARRKKAAARAEVAAAIAAPADQRGPRAILYVVFALSGLTGLVYEATWTRYLQLFLGHAAYAQVLVIALFMGGMAVGALLASRLSRARIAPLMAYAAIEAGLGLAALVFHPVFDAVTTFAYDVLLPGTQESALAPLVQWLLASALIIPQSILLGMTFPLMSAAVLRLGSGAGGRVFALLYFANSAGAVIGVLLAGFWLIESYGLQMTMMAAGAGNLCVAAIAFAVAQRRDATAAAITRPTRGKGVGRWLLAFAFFTAVGSFLYEIAWLRMLAMVQGASTHAFETMLSAFILGIALGGLWIRGRIERYASPLAALARVQIFMGLAALATLPTYHFAFDAMQAALAWLPRSDTGYLEYNAVGYLIAAAIMVPASFCAGMTLPLLTFVLYSRGRGESEIGAVYGWNTLGSIAGVALGSMVLMPLIGLKNTLVFGAGVDIALGVALGAVLIRRGEIAAPRLGYALAAMSVAALTLALFAFEFDATRTASGVFRYGKARIADTSKVIFHADGRTATVDLVSQSDGAVSITTNGKSDAAINMLRARGDLKVAPTSDEYTMTLLGTLPLAHAPKARTAAVIGHGTGLTTHVILGAPAIERVDVIEIEPEMIRASREFRPRVARAYDDPRARYFIEDARAFFARASRRYDFIVSEPSNPWVSGVASLFTPEFYRQAKRALVADGLFVQWFHLYEMDRPLVQSIVSGIGAVFSDYVFYAGNDDDVILVASASGKLPPLTDAPFAWPALRAELEYLDIRSPAQLKLFRIASRRAYAPLLENGRLSSDYFPYLEYGAARARFLGKSDAVLIDTARDPLPLLEMLSGFEAPVLTAGSMSLAAVYPRFSEVGRATQIAAVFAQGGSSVTPTFESLHPMDKPHMERVHDLAANGSPAAWQDWFSALFGVSKALIPNGGAPAIEQFVRTARVTAALRDAPPDIREKVEFLLLVGKRDVAGIRAQGERLLAGSLQQVDPAFHAYAFFATAATCLMTAPDAACGTLLSSLDRVRRPSALLDLLRAHRSARVQVPVYDVRTGR